MPVVARASVPGSVWALLLIAALDALLGMASGLFVSAFATTEFQAMQFMPVFVLPQVLLCGLFQPRADMGWLLNWLSDVMPLSYAVEALTQVTTVPEWTVTLTRNFVWCRGVRCSRSLWAPPPSAAAPPDSGCVPHSGTVSPTFGHRVSHARGSVRVWGTSSWWGGFGLTWDPVGGPAGQEGRRPAARPHRKFRAAATHVKPNPLALLVLASWPRWWVLVARLFDSCGTIAVWMWRSFRLSSPSRGDVS